MRGNVPLLAIEGLQVAFPRANGHAPALRGLDLVIERGETVGVVGQSGSGKTLTWIAVLRLLRPDARVSGSVWLDGEDLLARPLSSMSEIRGKRIAMIFQDASNALNPMHKIGTQICESLSFHYGIEGKQAREEARSLLDQVGLPEAQRRLAQYPHELSGGMNQRVMIAMALAGAPDLLIADEPTTALDPTVQAQILELLRNIAAARGMALIFISHDLGVVAQISERVVVMRDGAILEDAPAERFFETPQHPYARALLAASRSLEDAPRPLKTIREMVDA